ncbi:MAG: ankyrin repeat domain-containing protein [Kiritimatiellae bacterium]|nr:ankyrin repeat domain-containing protein [Kiritimatiellia bacterium]
MIRRAGKYAARYGGDAMDDFGDDRTLRNNAAEPEKSFGSEKTLAGRQFLGRIDQYELIRELGGGGFGTVYLARDTVSGVEVAVKGLPPVIKNSAEDLENIRANFLLVQRLHHPNIAAALTLHPASRVEYSDNATREKLRVLSGETLLVMQYAPGVTLSQWRKQFPDRKVPLEKALDITSQVASALDYAHRQKIIHRDIKPSNVMVETQPDGSIVARVLDFGLAAEIRSSMGRISREVRDTSGTRPYMAPEQWQGEKQGPATDQYALAAMFYELVTGEVPFSSAFDCGDPMVMMVTVTTRQAKIPGSLPKPVCVALARALAKKPEERFASCGDFADALDGKRVKPISSCRRKRPLLKWLAALYAAAAVAAGVITVWQWNIKREAAKAAAEMMVREAEENIKHHVYELKGKAGKCRDASNREEWQSWELFKDKANDLDIAFRAGESAFEKNDFPAAKDQFTKVSDIWEWLVSNKTARTKAVDARDAADAARKSAAAANASKFSVNENAQADEIFKRAEKSFTQGLFGDAEITFGNARTAYDRATELANVEIARRAEAERVAEAERLAEIEAANKARAEKERKIREENERIAAEKKAEEERKERKIVEGRKANRKIIDLFKADKWDEGFACIANAFEDDPELDYQLGRAYSTDYKRRNYLTAREYFRKASKRMQIRQEEIEKVEEEALFELVSKCRLEEVKAEINVSTPYLSLSHDGYTLMHHAAHKRDHVFLEYLNSLGHSVNASSGTTGKTPLFYACANTNRADSLDCIDWLLSHGSDCNVRVKSGSEVGKSPIFHARDVNAFKRLLQAGASVDVVDGLGRTILHELAQYSDDAELISYAVDKCRGKINSLSNIGESVVHSAIGISHFNPDVLDVLLKHGAKADAVIGGNGSDAGFAPIHKAIYWMYPKAVERLADYGVDVNQRVGDSNKFFHGFSSIQLLARKGWHRDNDQEVNAVVKTLVKHGADINEHCKGFYSGEYLMFEGYTPLHIASESSNAELVSALIDNGANLEATDANGATALYLACTEYGIDERTMNIIKILLRRGANPNVADKTGKKLLDAVKNADVKKLLLDAAGLRGNVALGNVQRENGIQNQTDKTRQVTEIALKAFAAGNWDDGIKLSKQGDETDPRLQYWRGYCAEKGIGEATDEKKAAQLYLQSANGGCAEAQHRYGLMCFIGRVVERNLGEAMRWNEKAAEHGNVKAQKFLAIQWDGGHSVPRNEEKAVKWYRLAAKNGDEEAKKWLQNKTIGLN